MSSGDRPDRALAAVTSVGRERARATAWPGRDTSTRPSATCSISMLTVCSGARAVPTGSSTRYVMPLPLLPIPLQRARAHSTSAQIG